ncbi:phospholipid/cholesterol/gamma-HCH transport system substrate-binding protein [Blastococcus colisei]|uniref:Phospholipid/cholesterol/gamma-HCH transport system substrate-binding protein n=1 Tax=Blastococcus colisei TaxID=1564162 RepID=A0A543PB79_9ACTN|nr:MlaD family protein [Blastococcus colisei]TQN41332.1 phospholipid/cholesterol/gamma-HCH transport system substrate-binding protein [Blastococcus colisei]
MITRGTKLKLLAFVTLAVLGMAYLGFKYVGLDRALLGGGYEVAADFRDSGGIFVNAEVTYRGVAVGRVTDMELVEDGVRVTLRMDPGSDPIPADADAVVATRSAVGEQYVLLRPRKEGGPYLEEGAIIPQERTSIPVPVEQMLLNIDEFVGSIDQENLRIVIEELGRAFEGAGEDLGRLIDNGDLLLARAQQSLPQTLQLITDGQTVLDTQRDSRSAIRQWAADLRLFTDTLVEMDPDLRSIVVNAPDAGEALEDLVEGAGPGLGSLVRNLDILNGVQIPRLDGIRQMLVTYPDAVTGGFTVVRRDEDGVLRSHFGFVLNAGEPHACATGYVATGSTPSQGAVENVDTDAIGCEVVNGVDPDPGDGYDENGSNIRGEQNIGRDGGRGVTTPQEEVEGSSPLSATALSELVGGLLHANPIATLTG